MVKFLKGFLNYFFQSPVEKHLKKQGEIYRKMEKEIQKRSSEYSNLTNEELEQKILELKEMLSKSEPINSKNIQENEIIETFSLVRELSSRTLNLRHYDVQLIGGMALSQQMIAEMQTGEGKTLTASLPAIYFALKTNKPVHIVTANSYLAERDANDMKKLYEKFGLTTSYNFSPNSPSELKQKPSVYKADIIYSSASDLVLDYLRSTTQIKLEDVLIKQDDMNFVIIDEADFILLDSARDSVILAELKPFDSRHLKWARDTALKLKRSADDYLSGNKFTEKMNYSNMTQEDVEIMKAKEEIGEELIVDGSGTIIDGDYYLDELNQIVHFFESAYDVIDIELKEYGYYDIKTVPHFHHMVQQAIIAEYAFERDKHYIVSDGNVMIVNLNTGRVMPMSRWEDGLHQAVEHKENVKIQDDSRTIASITYQSFFNMYSYKAGMTGTAKSEESELLEVYNLPVFQVPTHKPSIRIDHKEVIYYDDETMFDSVLELVKERLQRGQPILIGTPNISMSESLAEKFNQAKIPFNLLNAKNIKAEAKIIADAGKSSTLTISTNMSGRGTDIILGGNINSKIAELDELLETGQINESAYQKRLQKTKDAWKKDYDKVVDAGGLLVLAIGLTETRRTVNQLRGRAGRQGDIGETMSLLSFDDKTLSMTNQPKIIEFMKGKMLQMGIKTTNEAAPQYDFLWSQVAQKSQKTIENLFSQQRKNTLRYETIQNKQRLLFNQMRERILELSDEDVVETFHDYCKDFMFYELKKRIHYGLPEFETYGMQIENILNTMIEILKELDETTQKSLLSDSEQLINKLMEISLEEYDKNKDYDSLVMQGVQTIIDLHNLRWKAILLLEDKKIQTEFIKRMFLTSMSEMWYDYIHNMEILKNSSRFAIYAKKEPFYEFSQSSHQAFMHLLETYSSRAVQEIFNEPMVDKIDLDNIILHMKNHNVDFTDPKAVAQFLDNEITPALFQTEVLSALNEERVDIDEQTLANSTESKD